MKYQLAQCLPQLDRVPSPEILSAAQLELDFSEFAFVSVVTTRWMALLREYKAFVSAHGSPIGIHGCLDTCLDSPDKRVRYISHENYRMSVNVARELGASYCIFHAYLSSENPTQAIEDQLLFWQELCASLPLGLTLAIENVWEPDPEALLALVERINHPQVKLCLDTGHVNVHSPRSLEEWVQLLAPHLAYVHLHWNSGRADEHRAPGEAVLNRVFRALESAQTNPVIALEYDSEDIAREAERVRSFW